MIQPRCMSCEVKGTSQKASSKFQLNLRSMNGVEFEINSSLCIQSVPFYLEELSIEKKEAAEKRRLT